MGNLIKKRASSAIGSTRYETATNSICPKGWRLPQGPNGTNGSEFETMLKVAGIANSNNTDNGSGSSVNVGYTGGSLSGTDMEKTPIILPVPATSTALRCTILPRAGTTGPVP